MPTKHNTESTKTLSRLAAEKLAEARHLLTSRRAGASPPRW